MKNILQVTVTAATNTGKSTIMAEIANALRAYGFKVEVNDPDQPRPEWHARRESRLQAVVAKTKKIVINHVSVVRERKLAVVR